MLQRSSAMATESESSVTHTEGPIDALDQICARPVDSRGSLPSVDLLTDNMVVRDAAEHSIQRVSDDDVDEGLTCAWM